MPSNNKKLRARQQTSRHKVLIDYRRYRLANIFLNFFGRNKFELVIFLLGTVMFCIFFAEILKETAIALKPTILQNWYFSSFLFVFFDFIIGIAMGSLSFSMIMKEAMRPWLTVLPWSSEDKVRAVIAALVIPLLVQSIAIACFSAGLLWLIDSSEVLFGIVLALAAFALGLGISVEFSRIKSNSEFEKLYQLKDLKLLSKPSLQRRLGFKPKIKKISSALSWLDQCPPKWIGHWTFRGADSFSWLFCFFSLLLLCSFGVMAGLELKSSFPISLAAVLGGHLVFILFLDLSPLASPILRIQPIRYEFAWVALLRLPYFFSVFWFLLPSLFLPLTHLSSVKMVSKEVLLLLVINVSFAMIYSSIPTNKITASIMYFSAISLMLYEYGEINMLVFPAFAFFAVFLWIRGKDRFYKYG